MGKRGWLQVAIFKQKKHTRAWRPGEKAALRNLPSETDEDGQQRLAQVQYLSKNNHTRAWRPWERATLRDLDRKSTRLNSSHANISYAVFCLKKKKINKNSVNHI